MLHFFSIAGLSLTNIVLMVVLGVIVAILIFVVGKLISMIKKKVLSQLNVHHSVYQLRLFSKVAAYFANNSA